MAGDTIDLTGLDDKQLSALAERLDKFRSSSNKASTAALDMISSFEKMFALGTDGGTKVDGITNAFGDLKENISNTKVVFEKFTGAMEALGSKVPGVGEAVKAAFSAFSTAGNVVAMVGEETIKWSEVVIRGLDAPSAKMREYDALVFNIGKQFGGTIEEAQSFMDTLNAQTNTDFARSMHLTKQQMLEMTKATENTNIAMKKWEETVDTGIGKVTLLTAVTGQAAAMGISFGAAAGLMNTAMAKQGLSAQEAVEQMGAFKGVSDETGLKISTVAETLNSAVSGFEKLGLSADFGRPILEGFGRVMNNMGLGIEEATGMTNSLSKALADLTTDYSNAYIIFQRGGLDIGGGGGGGVLQASIGLQAAIAKGDDADVASQMLGGLKDTLASFTGGSIVTVGQAAESPEMANQFYIQQQMLKNQFGIGDDKTAVRVLDLLSQLDDATRSGDKDAKKSLEEQLSNEMQGRDETLGEWEKANQELAIQSNLLAIIARPGAFALRSLGEGAREGMLTPLIEKGGEMARGATAAATARIANVFPEGDPRREALMAEAALGNEMSSRPKKIPGVSEDMGVFTADFSSVGQLPEPDAGRKDEMTRRAIQVALSTDDETLKSSGVDVASLVDAIIAAQAKAPNQQKVIIEFADDAKGVIEVKKGAEGGASGVLTQ